MGWELVLLYLSVLLSFCLSRVRVRVGVWARVMIRR